MGFNRRREKGLQEDRNQEDEVAKLGNSGPN